MVLNFFEKIDLIGSKFHFYYGVSLQKRTPLGEILTLLIAITTIAFLFIFGKELFLKSNPNITISIQNDSKYEYINLKKENITFALKIEKKSGELYNISKILYVKILYYISEPNEEGKYNSKIKEEYINYHICNDSDFIYENLTTYYGTLFCVDSDEKILGGYYDNPYIYSFEFQVYFCKNGNKYSINDSCTSIETLNNIFQKDNPIYFSFFYPIVEFNPFSYDIPLKVHYKKYYNNLNHRTHRTDQFYLKKTILDDDKGLFFNDIKNISFWGIDQITSSYDFFYDNDLIIEGSSSKIYSLTIHNSVENNYYTRHYTKFQNVIAIVGSIFNLILNFCIFLNHSIGESLRKLEILNDYFEFEDNSFYQKNFSHCNELDCKNVFSKSPMTKPRKILFQPKFSTSFPKKYINNDVLNIKSKKFSYNQTLYEGKINNTDQSHNKFFHRKSVPVIRTSIIFKDNNHFKKSNLTLRNIVCENIKIYLFFCCNNKNYANYFNVKHSNLLQYYYIYLIQINRYLKIVHEYDFLKKAFLNHHQIKGLLFLRRINLTDKSERDSIAENKNNIENEENVVNYFKNKISINELSRFDKIILNNLSQNVKDKIV